MIVGVGSRPEEDDQIVGLIDQHPVVIDRRLAEHRGRCFHLVRIVRGLDHRVIWDAGLAVVAIADFVEADAQILDIIV